MPTSETNEGFHTSTEPPPELPSAPSTLTKPPLTQGEAAPQGPAPAEVRRVGPYVLDRLLGSGSFGDVWLATRTGELAHTRHAVKLPNKVHVDLEAVRQEAALWARVGGHPNILPLYEASVYDGQVVIVSEYIAGGSLADWLKANGGKAPSPEVAVQMILDVLAGLKHLHGLGVVHRDIKPANVLLQNETPRLADFGISRALGHHTDTLRPAGTPAYMAPESFDGDRSVRTDIWSVGVMLYQLLTGTLPYPEREWTAVLKAILTRDPPPLPDCVPAPFVDVIRSCLAKDPARRCQTVSQLVEKLNAAVCSTATGDKSVKVMCPRRVSRASWETSHTRCKCG